MVMFAGTWRTVRSKTAAHDPTGAAGSANEQKSSDSDSEDEHERAPNRYHSIPAGGCRDRCWRSRHDDDARLGRPFSAGAGANDGRGEKGPVRRQGLT